MARRRLPHSAHRTSGTGKTSRLPVEVMRGRSTTLSVSCRAMAPQLRHARPARQFSMIAACWPLTARRSLVWFIGSTYGNVPDGFEGLVDGRSRLFFTRTPSSEAMLGVDRGQGGDRGAELHQQLREEERVSSLLRNHRHRGAALAELAQGLARAAAFGFPRRLIRVRSSSLAIPDATPRFSNGTEKHGTRFSASAGHDIPRLEA